VTGRLKKQLDTAYGLFTTTEGELAHLVSLELGGAVADPANLWVGPGKIPNPKDAVETSCTARCSPVRSEALTDHVTVTHDGDGTTVGMTTKVHR
jgi:hypothetical protein